MARDLAKVREVKVAPKTPLEIPKAQPLQTPQAPQPPKTPKEERKLSDILAEARERLAKPQAEPTRPQPSLSRPQAATELSSAAAELSSAAAEGEKPKTPPPGPKVFEDELPIEEAAIPPSTVSPKSFGPRTEPETPVRGLPDLPPNLPVGEPSLTVPESREIEAPAPAPKITPEEILGLKRAPQQPVPYEQIRTGPTPISERRLKEIVRPKVPQPAPVTTPKPKLRRGLPRTVPPKAGLVRGLPAPKFALITGVLAIMLLAASWGIYWTVLVRHEAPAPPAPAPAPSPKPSEPVVPESLINFTQREIIEIDMLNYSSLKPKIDALGEANFSPQSLIDIPIKHVSGTAVRFPGFSAIMAALGISAPEVIEDPKNFALYLYSQGPQAQQVCAQAGITDTACYGPRLGIVLQLQKQGEGALTKDSAASAMREWEKTIADDLLSLMLFSPQIPPDYIAGEEFATGRHATVDTHYKNFPIHTMSVDWILTDTHLVIATSKDSARAALDALK